MTAGANVWRAIDPADDEDYFSFSVSRTTDYWIHILGDLDTVGELLDSNGMSIESDDYGDVLPNTGQFLPVAQNSSPRRNYIKVTGYGSTDETLYPQRQGISRTPRPRSKRRHPGDQRPPRAGPFDPEDDQGYFKLELSETTEGRHFAPPGFPDNRW